MKKVRVEIPFYEKTAGKTYKKGDEIEVSEEMLASIRAVNVNMVVVQGDVVTKDEATLPKKTTRAKKTEK